MIDQRMTESRPSRRSSLSRRTVVARTAAAGLAGFAATASAASGAGVTAHQGVPLAQTSATPAADSGYVTVSGGLEM